MSPPVLRWTHRFLGLSNRVRVVGGHVLLGPPFPFGRERCYPTECCLVTFVSG
jgi:hypothetical protein